MMPWLAVVSYALAGLLLAPMAVLAEVPAPILDEPVFAGTAMVGVHSIGIGTTIKVRSGSEDLGSAATPHGAVSVALTRALVAGEQLQAIASTPSGESASSLPVAVQPLPTKLAAPKVSSAATLISGGVCIGASGLVPYAKGHAWNDGESVPIGTGRANEKGAVTIPLHRPLTTADKIRLEADIGGTKSGKSNPALLPVRPIGEPPFNETLPGPVIGEPLRSCERVVALSGLQPGARYEIRAHNTGTIFGPHCAVAPAHNNLVARALEQNQQISAQQRVEAEGLESLWTMASVGPQADRPPAPSFLPPELYAGQQRVHLAHLVAGAELEVTVKPTQDKSKTFIFVIGAAGDFDLGTKLEAGWTLQARQKSCDRWSDVATATVLPAPGTYGPPTLEPPLYPCASLVRIADMLPGAVVRVTADGQTIGSGVAKLISVAPHLQGGQVIAATQTVGDRTSGESNKVVVSSVGESLAAPEIAGDGVGNELASGLHMIEACAAGVTASGVLPGAQVSVFSKDQLFGTTEATAVRTSVPLSVPLRPGMTIRARQNICTVASGDSDKLIAIGKLRVADPSLGQVDLTQAASKPVSRKVPVTAQCAALEKAMITLTSSDPSIVKVKGTGTTALEPGQSNVEFDIEIAARGSVTLAVAAPDYRQTDAATWDLTKTPREFSMVVVDWVKKAGQVAMRREESDVIGDQPYIGTIAPVTDGELLEIVNKTSLSIHLVDNFNMVPYQCGGKLKTVAIIPPGGTVTKSELPWGFQLLHAGKGLNACVTGGGDQFFLDYVYQAKG
jgi:hypothetical protein